MRLSINKKKHHILSQEYIVLIHDFRVVYWKNIFVSEEQIIKEIYTSQ